MTIITTSVEYQHDGVLLEGHLAYDDSHNNPRPAVLVSHAWGGRSEFECEKAERLASLGYTGFALDLYGKGVLGSGPEENQKLMGPLLEDRPMLQARLNAALETVKSLPQVDPNKVAAMGYCFGGLCVLDMARAGLDVKGVISLHGLFAAPGNTGGNSISAKVLALHGWDDPMVPPEQVLALTEEMKSANADWQLHAYGGAVHAFTNPQANDADFGTVYDADADRRSWQSVENFFAEVLG